MVFHRSEPHHPPILYYNCWAFNRSAETGSNKNLSVSYIAARLNDFGLVTKEITQLENQLLEYRELLKHSRNGLIVHLDQRAVRENMRFGEHTKVEAFAFQTDLNQFTDAVGRILDIGPLDYSVQSGKGDVLNLIKVLQAGRAAISKRSGNL